MDESNIVKFPLLDGPSSSIISLIIATNKTPRKNRLSDTMIIFLQTFNSFTMDAPMSIQISLITM